MGHLPQLNAESGVELRHRSRQHHGAASHILLLHRETVCGREGAYGGEIRGVGTMPFRKFIPAQEGTRRAAGRDCGHSGRQILPRAPAHEYGHFQALGRIGRPERLGTLHRCAFAALERNVGHWFIPDDDPPSVDRWES
jgi:hypothetical protein